ncbi:hypothetical protein HYH03_002253 [Edaphochlamys debaryana]|uniref:Uncharacterized protein n=1 Tax=Edaphochlamys debaryana TaxID=47281 RepID=A0A835YC56_9CHLO|nr:hypothetical protein HYH03_002253 [Edaphochlamys debaryana]|eukprot:KAG2499968.1 hypothetical protein HYH03_002253 [Edaphochlamys debaryana]
MSYSRRVQLLRKPALTAADKTAVPAEERRRIFKALRTPSPFFRTPPSSASASASSASPSSAPPHQPLLSPAPLPRPLRVFCYGIDDVRLYKALEAARALGRVVVVPDVAASDAVLASRVKRTGKKLTLTEVANAARKLRKPLLELPTLSPQRVMEAVESLTGWAVPGHLRERPPQPGQGLLSWLPPLEAGEEVEGAEGAGAARQGGGGARSAAEALQLLTGGVSLSQHLLVSSPQLPAEVLAALDRVPDLCASNPDSPYCISPSLDLEPSSDDVKRTHAPDLLPLDPERALPVNPQEREAARVKPLVRPHMDGSKIRRQRMLAEAEARRAEAAGEVTW